MRLPCFILCCVAGALAPRAVAADAAAKVRAALQDFLDQPNYTWVVGNTRGIPEANGDDVELASDGQHEKGGYTMVNLRRGPHIPADEMPVTKPWPGFTDRDEVVSTRWVFWTPDDWKLLSQLPLPPGTGPPALRGPITPRGGVSVGRSIPLGSISLGTSMVRRFFGFRRPDQEMAIVLPNLDEVTEVRPDVFEATLTYEGATKLISIPRPAGMVGLVGPTVEKGSARVSLRIRDGQLVHYELACNGVMAIFGRRSPRTFTLIRDLRAFGTTVIKVPNDVRRMFGDTPADPASGGP